MSKGCSRPSSVKFKEARNKGRFFSINHRLNIAPAADQLPHTAACFSRFVVPANLARTAKYRQVGPPKKQV